MDCIELTHALKTANIITAKNQINKQAKHMLEAYFPILLNEIIKKTAFLTNNPSIRLRIACIKHSVQKEGKCKSCKAFTSFDYIRGKFHNYCVNTKGRSCGYLDPQEAIKKKYQQTCFERYGVANPAQSDEIKDKKKQTCYKKYGGPAPISHISIKSKTREKWSSKTNEELEIIKQKRRTTNIKKYGAPTYAQGFLSPTSVDKSYNVAWLTEQHVDNNKTISSIAQELGYTTATLCSRFHALGLPIIRHVSSNWTSKAESEIAEICSHTKVLRNSKHIIPPYELDIYLPEHNLAIEYNGVYWHSELNGGRDKNYHLNKTNLCANNNIRLVHIISTEWIYKQEIVKSRLNAILGLNNRVYARKCIVQDIDNETTCFFLTNNHIQGHVQGKVNLGLIYNNELIALMSFGKSRFNKSSEWEMLRFCSKLNTTVVGGASKLFQYFIKQHHPTSIISYSDKRWNTGKLYAQLGFEHLRISAPNYFYFHVAEPSVLYTRIRFQKHKLSNILETFDPDLTEWENMMNNNYDRIWDCGNDVFCWNKLI